MAATRKRCKRGRMSLDDAFVLLNRFAICVASRTRHPNQTKVPIYNGKGVRVYDTREVAAQVLSAMTGRKVPVRVVKETRRAKKKKAVRHAPNAQ